MRPGDASKTAKTPEKGPEQADLASLKKIKSNIFTVKDKYEKFEDRAFEED